MKRLAKAALDYLGYRVQATKLIPRQLLSPGVSLCLEFDDVLCRRMFEHGPELSFIQVGVCDGITADPLRKYIERCGWRGVLVEPQAAAANALRELYRDNTRIQILQAAVDGTTGTRTLLTVRSPSAPEWAAGLASFDPKVVMKHAAQVPGLHDMLVEETVNCVTFEAVLRLLPTQQVDLLQVDTEGADADVLALFPFSSVRPAIVHFEVKHLTKAVQEDCLERLLIMGYRFAPSGGEDMIAVLKDD
jgi:FkbM family methyltransferase